MAFGFASHLVRLFAFVEQTGQGAAIVMELVDGVSLREMLARRGPLDAPAALVVMKDSLLGLAAAHSRRVPRRDVKPDNVLIDTGGWCKLADCGVAVKPDKQPPVAGTPTHMAPELRNGAERCGNRHLCRDRCRALGVRQFDDPAGRPWPQARLAAGEQPGAHGD